MTKKKSRKAVSKRPAVTKKSAKQVQRDYQLSQSQRLLDRRTLKKVHKPFNIKLNEIQDKRYDIAKTDRTLDSRPARVDTYQVSHSRPHYKTRYKIRTYSNRFGFKKPRQTVVCWRRKIRRAVLFATKNTGKGSRSKRNYTPTSKINCRRK